MERGQLLSPGASRLSPAEAEIVERLRGRRPGRRTAPWSREAPFGDLDAGTRPRRGGEAKPRGDHDLNPDFYEPGRALTPAAVLVPIVRRPEPTLLLTRRTDHLHDHAGQISFPGGRVDRGDADAVAAALRETEEEVGLPRDRIEVVGRLDTYLTRTGFEITPLVGLVTPPFPVAPDDFEVAEVFELPLSFFLDPESRKLESRLYQGRERFFYAFPYDEDYYVWGATAGMLVNLAEILA